MKRQTDLLLKGGAITVIAWYIFGYLKTVLLNNTILGDGVSGYQIGLFPGLAGWFAIILGISLYAFIKTRDSNRIYFAIGIPLIVQVALLLI